MTAVAGTPVKKKAKLVVGMGEFKISNAPESEIVTYALGSCLGITIYDPITRVGGLLHVMMPSSEVDPARAKSRPGMFVDTAVPRLFRNAYQQGAVKQRIVVKVAGGAQMHSTEKDHFNIGARNFAALRRLLWQNSVLIRGHDTGGTQPRTMSLRLRDGQVTIRTKQGEQTL